MSVENQNLVENEAKTKRYELRNEIGDLVFNLEQILKESLGLSPIKLGEAQSEKFIGKANEIAEDDSIWSKLPEKFESDFTLHGVSYKKEGVREELREKLRDLIKSHS